MTRAHAPYDLGHGRNNILLLAPNLSNIIDLSQSRCQHQFKLAHTGQTLDYLEGVFASGVLHIAFCDASTDEAIRRDEASPHTEGPAPFAKDSGRLVCAGYDANGTVTIKGLSVSSLMEKFYLRLVENPTHVRVANRRPIVAIGYADGALNAVHFGEDRYADGKTSRNMAQLGVKVCASR